MKLPNAFIPATILAFALLCLPLREVFNFPAASITLGESGSIDDVLVRRVEMIVQGVKCKGTAEFFLSRYEDRDGILDLEAYAADHKVIVTYDVSRIDADRIRAIGEAPIRTRSGELRKFFVIEELTDR